MASSQSTQPTRIFQSAAAAENAYREQLARNETFNEQFEVMTTKLDSLTAKLDQLVNLMLTQQTSQSLTVSEPVPVRPPTDNVPPTSPVDLGLGPPRSSSDPTGIQLSSYTMFPRSPRRPPHQSPRSRSPPQAPQIDQTSTQKLSLTGVHLPKFHDKYLENLAACCMVDDCGRSTMLLFLLIKIEVRRRVN